MIEFNLKAKPFNAVEQLIGISLFNKCYDSFVVGEMGWNVKPSENAVLDVLLLIQSKNWDDVSKILSEAGWGWTKKGFSLPNAMFVYQKDGHKIFITHDVDAFHNMRAATLVCKMCHFGLNEKVAVENIHYLIMNKAMPSDKVLGVGFNVLFNPKKGVDEVLLDALQVHQADADAQADIDPIGEWVDGD